MRYITARKTLTHQIGMSLQERAVDFMSKYPGKKMSSTTLSRIYKHHNIKRKNIRMTKIVTAKQRKKIKRTKKEAQEELQGYISRKFRIISTDETMYTKSTIPKLEYSPKRFNFELDYKNLNNQTIAIIAAVSSEMGIDLVMTFPKSVDVPKYKVFLEELRQRYFFDDICLYMDNLAVHRSKVIRERMDELSIAYVFNPPYSPEYQGIESVFSIFKRKLKKERFRCII